MKNISNLVGIIILSVFISFPLSCIKRDLVTQPNNSLKLTLKNWMEGQKIGNASSNTFIDSLENMASWHNLSVLSINNMEDLVYVPVKYNSNKTGLTFIISSKNLTVERGFLSEINTSVLTQNGVHLKMGSQIKDPALIMTNFYRYKLNDFTGNIVGYDISNKFLWEMGYASGTNIYKKNIISFSSDYKPPVYIENGVLKTSPFEGVAKNIAPGCFAYYLVTYWEDMEASVSIKYLNQICDHNCEVTKVISKDTASHFATFCRNN